MAGGGIKINNIKINGGADGATFIPSVSSNGVLSWTNDKGYTNPTPVNIKGADGQDGVDGATGAKLVSQVLQGQDANGGNIYLQTFDDGTTAIFTAPKGEKGEPGAGIPIVQTTGNSEESVMSQNAVTVELNSKVDKLTGQAMVYRTNPSSNSDTDYISYTSENTPKTFMVRDEKGMAKVNIPTLYYHCANKGYVDGKIKNTDIVYSAVNVLSTKVAKWIANLSTSGIGFPYFQTHNIYISAAPISNVIWIDFINERLGYLKPYTAYANFSDVYLDSELTTPLTVEWLNSHPEWAVNSVSFVVLK